MPIQMEGKKLEDYLLSLYSRFLELEKIGHEDNFFVLGGDSIRATQIANQIQSRFPSVPIDTVTIFEYPTVQELHQFFMTNIPPEILKAFGQQE